jgi:hypothetical protein
MLNPYNSDANPVDMGKLAPNGFQGLNSLRYVFWAGFSG